MAEDFYDWHSGVEFDRDTRKWRAYVKHNETGRQQFAEGEFEDKADAAVAASDYLTRLRGEDVVTDGEGLPRI